MSRTYVDQVNLIEQMLQDSANAEFLAADINFGMEEGLKILGSNLHHPNIVPVRFKVESRYGTVSATSSSNLTDTTKSQFVSADATNDKRVHNTTDNTWATVSSYTSTSVLALNSDIFVSGDQYEIYDKQCNNKRQIYIGNVTDYIRIDRVEYPIGRNRNWKFITNNVIEIHAAYIQDSDSTLTPLQSVDVIVYFVKPHVLSQLTDWAGEVDLGAGYAAGTATIHIDGLGATEVIEEGDQFTIENHSTIYTITADTTLSSNEGDITFYPGLEAAVIDNDDITFVKSTLLPDDETNLAEYVVAWLSVYHAPKFFSAIGAMGAATTANYSNWGERRLAQVTAKMRGQTGARTTYHNSRY